MKVSYRQCERKESACGWSKRSDVPKKLEHSFVFKPLENVVEQQRRTQPVPEGFSPGMAKTVLRHGSLLHGKVSTPSRADCFIFSGFKNKAVLKLFFRHVLRCLFPSVKRTQ
jgi:hypothetical protein